MPQSEISDREPYFDYSLRLPSYDRMRFPMPRSPTRCLQRQWPVLNKSIPKPVVVALIWSSPIFAVLEGDPVAP